MLQGQKRLTTTFFIRVIPAVVVKVTAVSQGHTAAIVAVEVLGVTGVGG